MASKKQPQATEPINEAPELSIEERRELIKQAQERLKQELSQLRQEEKKSKPPHLKAHLRCPGCDCGGLIGKSGVPIYCGRFADADGVPQQCEETKVWASGKKPGASKDKGEEQMEFSVSDGGETVEAEILEETEPAL